MSATTTAPPVSIPLLGPAQERVVAATDHRLLIGPAGTGKTTALQHCLASAARRDGADTVLGLAPSRAAARQWQADLARLLGGSGVSVVPRVLTVAALATKVLGARAGDGDAAAGSADDAELRILTAPEQESRIRQILAGTQAEWPAELKPALTTRSFARRLRRIVAHARRAGWDPRGLQEVAAQRGDATWVAIGQFLEEYLTVLDWEGSVDHAEVVLRALRRLDAGLPTAMGPVTTIVADDVQDWSRAQARLVLAVAAAGNPQAEVIAAADPDRAASSYRGGDLTAIELIRAAGARIVVADTVYRGGTRMRDARAALMGTRWYPGLPVGAAAAFRLPVVASTEPDVVTAVEFDDAVCQSRHVADRLRRAHRAGVPWRDMAVLTSSPATEIPLLARSLAQARIPVHVPAGDLPLKEHPAVATLLCAATLVLAPPAGEGAPAEPAWHQLVTSDLVGLPPRDVRRLQRWLSDHPATETAAPLGSLIRTPDLAGEVPGDVCAAAAAVVALGARLDAARQCQDRGGTPAEILWLLWHGPKGSAGRSDGMAAGEWPERLRRRAEGPGEAALAAGRQLDAVVALFRLAERAPERWGGTRGLRALVDEIEHQEIPAEPDLKAEPVTDAVTLLSVHRAQGRAWPLVVVTGLSESAWRSSRLAGGPLDPGRLTEDDLLPAAPATDAAERRRRFNGLLGTAERELILTCCGGPDDPPTPLLAAAGLTVERVCGLPPAPRTPTELLLTLRRAASAPASAGTAAAQAALAAVLRARRRDGELTFPGLAADRWAGVRNWTLAPVPLRDPSAPLALSASGVESLSACPLRWFLQREVRAEGPKGRQAGFGLLVHAVAADLVRRGRAAGIEEIQTLLAEGWTSDDYDATWHEQQERALAGAAVDRAQRWLAGRAGELASEHPVDVVVPVHGDDDEIVDRVHVRGSVDLVERGDAGLVVWDFKTRRSAASRADVAANVQLAVYQAALESSSPVTAAGLVQLCVPAGVDDPDSPKVRQQPGISDDEVFRAWTGRVLRTAASTVRDERFEAQPGPGCRTCVFRASCPAHRPGATR